MNKLKNSLLLLLCGCLSVTFISCEKEEDDPQPLPTTMTGVFIVNEGAFLQGNGSISFLSDDSAYFNADLYKAVNNQPLGDVVQSMKIYRNYAYICVNNSQKVIVADMTNFKKAATISAGSPRYFIGYNNKGYISDWSDNTVKEIDLATNTITRSIACGTGPEQMLAFGGKLFVCNSGGFSTDSTLTVIDIATGNVTDTLELDVNPSALVMDAGNKLWVLCSGTTGPDFTPATGDDIGGHLYQIDPLSLSILKDLPFAQDRHPIKIQTDSTRQNLYYLDGNSGYTGNVMRMSVFDNTLPASAHINREFYGLGIKPRQGLIFGGVASFSTNSYVLRYTNNGTLIDSLQVGIGPNGFAFN